MSAAYDAKFNDNYRHWLQKVMPPTGERYGVTNGWLFEYVDEHTCGTARDGHYGAHEPGCGQVPIARVEDLLAAVTPKPLVPLEDRDPAAVAARAEIATTEETADE